MGKDVYVLVFDGFADWEPAHALDSDSDAALWFDMFKYGLLPKAAV